MIAKPALPPIPWDPVADSFISLPDQVLVDAVVKHPNLPAFIVPVGITQPCFGKIRNFSDDWFQGLGLGDGS